MIAEAVERPLGDDIDVENDRRTHQDCACEHTVHRANRLALEALCGGDDHLGENLGALDDLPLVGVGDTGGGDVAVLALGFDVEEIEQARHCPVVGGRVRHVFPHLVVFQDGNVILVTVTRPIS